MIFTYITQTHRWYNLINFYTLRTEIQNGTCEVSHSIFRFPLFFFDKCHQRVLRITIR